jgi:hypothetical protein
MFSGGGSVMKFQDGGDVLNRFASLSDEELRKAFEDAGRMRAPQGLLGKIMPSYSVPTGEGLEIQRLIQEEIERRIASRGLEGREMYGLRASVLQGRDPEISDKEIKMIEGAQETQDAIRKAFTLPTPVRFQDKPKPVEYSSIFIDRPELFAAPPGAEIAPESPATTAENGLTPGSPEVKPSEEEPGILDRFGKTVKSGKLQPLFDMMMRSGLGLAAGENIGEAGIAGLTHARAEAADELRARLGESEIELNRLRGEALGDTYLDAAKLAQKILAEDAGYSILSEEEKQKRFRETVALIQSRGIGGLGVNRTLFNPNYNFGGL